MIDKWQYFDVYHCYHPYYHNLIIVDLLLNIYNLEGQHVKKLVNKPAILSTCVVWARLTATVKISQPLTSILFCASCKFRYFPVPSINRDEKLLFAIKSKSSCKITVMCFWICPITII